MTVITTALLITLVVLILFVTQIIPLSITSVFGALAMGFCGVISFPDALSGFSADATLLVVGVIIIGNAMTETGATDIIGETLLKIPGAGQNERLMLIIVMSVSAAMSAFLSNVAVVAMFLPLVASMAEKSGGVITKKNTYMAIGMSALVGGGCTLVGSTPQLVAQGILESTEGCTPMGFFDLAKGGVLVVVIVIIYFSTIGYALEKKVFTFDEVVQEEVPGQKKKEINRPKALLSSMIFLGCIVCFVAGVGTVGAVGLVGGGLCIITGCISEKRAFVTMDWRSVAILGGTLGIAKGLNQSGAIEMIAEKTLALFGGESASPFLLCFVLYLLGTALANIVSHTATAAILTPLAIAIAQALGADPLTYVIAIIIGSGATFITPTATTPVTMTLVGGYRFMDYVKVGTPLNVITTIIAGLLIPVIYGL